MGKIELPVVNETRPKDEKRVRKRIPVDQKKVGNAPSNFQRGPVPGQAPGQRPPSPYQGNRPQGEQAEADLTVMPLQ
ncbi:MAG: hypothetical protein WKF59_20650 [Chitinophagaceae bacterium]